MRKALLLFFAPFALVGGAVGGYTYRLIEQGEKTYMDPWFLGAVALVVVGWFIRRIVLKKILEENQFGQIQLAMHDAAMDDMRAKVEEQEAVLNVIREGVLQKVDVVNGEVKQKEE